MFRLKVQRFARNVVSLLSKQIPGVTNINIGANWNYRFSNYNVTCNNYSFYNNGFNGNVFYGSSVGVLASFLNDEDSENSNDENNQSGNEYID